MFLNRCKFPAVTPETLQRRKQAPLAANKPQGQATVHTVLAAAYLIYYIKSCSLMSTRLITKTCGYIKL